MLSAAEEAELARLVEAQDGGETLAQFISRVSPRLPSPDHVKPLRDLFEEAAHRPVHALISIPPRHVKTTTILHGLAWFLSKFPATRNAYISATGSFAHTKSREAQTLTKKGGVPIAGEQVHGLGSEAAHLWTTTRGGGLLATGIGGQYIGHGTTGIQVIDDPYPNPKKAESDTYRREVWDWYEGVVCNRLEPGGSRIICHHRWHPDDLIGRLLREEPGKWRHINLPAVDGFSEEAYEAYKRGEAPIEAIGRALWPEYYPLEELLPNMRRKHFWWALYMGDPRLRGQKLFNAIPARFDLSKFSINGCYAAIAIDPAATKKTKADHSAIVRGAMRGHGDEAILYLLDVRRYQVEIPELVRRAFAIQRQHRLPLVVEAVAGFKSVPQMLRDIEPRLVIHEISPTQDKFIRAQPLADAWNEGRVQLPEDASWADEFTAEFERFTGVDDDEDDQVDGTAHLWNALHKPEAPRRMGVRRSDGPFG